MRSPTRVIAATTLIFEALVVFFAGLVAKDLSSLSTGAALGLSAGLALVCVLTAGLLRSPAGYVIGSVLQLVLILTGIWVPLMYGIGALFAIFWAGALYAGRKVERQVADRNRAQARLAEPGDLGAD